MKILLVDQTQYWTIHTKLAHPRSRIDNLPCENLYLTRENVVVIKREDVALFDLGERREFLLANIDQQARKMVVEGENAENS